MRAEETGGVGDVPPSIVDKLARAEFVAGALDEAVMLRRGALQAAIARFGIGTPQTAEAMTALARLYVELGRYFDAEPLLLAARQTLADPDRENNPAMAATLTALARVLLARGETTAAEPCARQAVAMARMLPQENAAPALRTLGAILAASSRYDEAETVLREAVARDRGRLGADAVETGRSLAQLANLHLRAGRPKDALPLIEQATAIDQDRLAEGHPFIGDDLHDLGLIYEGLKRGRDARIALQSALNSLELGAGRDTPRVAYVQSDLSRVLRELGDEAGAEAAFRDARRILNRSEREEHKRERQV